MLQKLFLLHANCIDDANELKTAIEKACPDNLTVELGYLGPIVGASAGPGTIALYFFGKEVTYNSQATE